MEVDQGNKMESERGSRIHSTAVLVSGRGSNLRALIAAEKAGQTRHSRITIVVSNRADAKALEVAAASGLRTQVLDERDFGGDRAAHENAILDVLRAQNVSIVVCAGWRRVLTNNFIGVFQGRVINIHPALLPAFPGLHAQRDAVEYGVRASGCTVHFVTNELDAGPIIMQRAVEVLPGDTEALLTARIQEQEQQIFPEALELLAANRLRIVGRRVRILRPRFDLMLATDNAGKAEEMRAILGAFSLRFHTPADFPNFTDVAENGETYEANAIKKGSTWHERTLLWALADDSGLEVDALGGRPGIRSARYAPTAEERNAKLLKELEGVPAEKRRARFMCVAALVGPGEEFIGRGTLEGSIAFEPRGTKGFGYDPIFIPDGFNGAHLAELDAPTKNQISHRARALAELFPALKERTGS